MQLKEDQQTARKDNAITNGTILRRLCMMIRKHDDELAFKNL